MLFCIQGSKIPARIWRFTRNWKPIWCSPGSHFIPSF